ncbi:hypothetical protein DWB77_07518 [Streptomyces hundungensis]|uniref:Uncharacterized protein n=1 Tax=Streptomyces hundungensis TaxID=1077946 RepID=A0A387HQB7_9ACTN|nr:hypothetical protein DWB77_07518 [Streptomyces hundungensis]
MFPSGSGAPALAREFTRRARRVGLQSKCCLLRTGQYGQQEGNAKHQWTRRAHRDPPPGNTQKINSKELCTCQHRDHTSWAQNLAVQGTGVDGQTATTLHRQAVTNTLQLAGSNGNLETIWSGGCSQPKAPHARRRVPLVGAPQQAAGPVPDHHEHRTVDRRHRTPQPRLGSARDYRHGVCRCHRWLADNWPGRRRSEGARCRRGTVTDYRPFAATCRPCRPVPPRIHQRPRNHDGDLTAALRAGFQWLTAYREPPTGVARALEHAARVSEAIAASTLQQANDQMQGLAALSITETLDAGARGMNGPRRHRLQGRCRVRHGNQLAVRLHRRRQVPYLDRKPVARPSHLEPAATVDRHSRCGSHASGAAAFHRLRAGGLDPVGHRRLVRAGDPAPTCHQLTDEREAGQAGMTKGTRTIEMTRGRRRDKGHSMPA